MDWQAGAGVPAINPRQSSSAGTRWQGWAGVRDIYQIWEGTAEIQRLVIAREITGRAL